MSRTDAGTITERVIAAPDLRRADFNAVLSRAGHTGAGKALHRG